MQPEGIYSQTETEQIEDIARAAALDRAIASLADSIMFSEPEAIDETGRVDSVSQSLEDWTDVGDMKTLASGMYNFDVGDTALGLLAVGLGPMLSTKITKRGLDNIIKYTMPAKITIDKSKRLVEEAAKKKALGSLTDDAVKVALKDKAKGKK